MVFLIVAAVACHGSGGRVERVSVVILINPRGVPQKPSVEGRVDLCWFLSCLSSGSLGPFFFFKSFTANHSMETDGVLK